MHHTYVVIRLDSFKYAGGLFTSLLCSFYTIQQSCWPSPSWWTTILLPQDPFELSASLWTEADPPSPNHECSLSSQLLMRTEIPSVTFSHSYSSYSCTQASKDLDFAHCCKTGILNSESKSLTSSAKGLYLLSPEQTQREKTPQN